MIRTRLDELGMTQAELARQSGVSKSAISAWITGERATGNRGPTPEKVTAVGRVLGYTRAEMLEAIGRTPPEDFNPEQQGELHELWSALNEDGREMTLASMRALVERRRRAG
ncbi:helix-turn-helix domain-containing protein [Embleya sp. NPDC056575]|uniref:helix-turn-helix domain-containing protein n=1 Tax=unclassified Embleya TaxID=2699296 RepID=UPI0036B49A0B